MNILGRSLFCAGICASLSSACTAHSVRYWLSYQDANAAALNAKSVGDELRQTVIVLGLSSITVGVMATATSDGLYDSGGVMFCFDSAYTNGTGKYASKAAWDAATLDQVFNLASLGSANLTWGKQLPGVNAGGFNVLVDAVPKGASAYSGSAGDGTSTRPAGVWAPFWFGSGNRLNLIAGQTVMLAAIKVSVDVSQLYLFGNYGWVDYETGLMIFGLPGADSRSTFLTGTNGSVPAITSKHSVGFESFGTTPPTAMPDVFNMTEDTVLTVAAPGVLANDTDPDYRDRLRMEIVTMPSHAASFTFDPIGVFTYTPQPNFSGVDTFTYRAVDHHKDSSAVTTSTINVAPVNDAPTLKPIPDVYTVEQQVVQFRAKASDPDLPNDVLTFSLENAPTGANIGSHDGKFSWTPTHSQAPGDYTFKVKVADNGTPGLTAERSVRVVVLPLGTASAISGTVALQDFSGPVAGEKVSFELRTALGAFVELIPNISLGPDGTFSIMSNNIGSYTLVARGRTWLGEAKYSVLLSGSSTAQVDFSLINGDVNGDNTIGTDDYLVLNDAFDSSIGDLRFDENADLNGDGYVGTDDYLILNNYFDQSGD